MSALLEVRDLCVDYRRGGRTLPALKNVGFTIGPGETLGLVGESGSGKSTVALSILRLLPEEGRVGKGEILFEGRDLLVLPEDELRRIRGPGIGIVFQDPFSSLNPVFTIGDQIEETVRSQGHPRPEEKARELLDQVQLPEAGRILASYPHQISGGQRQRVMLALAVSAGPKLLIADEPTTALDVTIQKEILELLRGLRERLGMSLLFVTHNLALVSEYADRCAVMCGGEVRELRPTLELIESPQDPYTRMLLSCVPEFPPRPL